MKQSGETLPQAAGGFGGSNGSTCWGREEGSVGQGTPTQAGPAVPGAGLRGLVLPPHSLPGSPAAHSLVLQRTGKRRHRQALPGFRQGLLPPRRHQSPGCPRRCGPVGVTSGTSSCLPPPPFSSFTTVLSFERFPHLSHPSRPLGNPRGPQPCYIFLLICPPSTPPPHRSHPTWRK